MKKIILLLLFMPFIGFAQNVNQPQFFNVNLDKAPKNILNKFSINEDKFTNITTIALKKNDSRRLQFYLNINQGKASFFMQTSYYGKEWIFLNSIIFLVDNERIEYQLNNVKREVIYGSGISEITGIYVDENIFKALEKISNTTSDVEVRYVGEKNNFDFRINKYMKEMLKETLDFYKLIKL
ncbi:hypothetical protein ACNQGP_00885 [Flavobacterium sp. GT2N3]|uniref:hypothetical protein n=1 Tax=unclassified Flavobacterium TaxID=196869 RepID=UPI003AAB7BD7